MLNAGILGNDTSHHCNFIIPATPATHPSSVSTSKKNITVVLVVKLVGHHSCGADRLPVAVRFPAGPRGRLKTVDPPKGNGLGQKKISKKNITLWLFNIAMENGAFIVEDREVKIPPVFLQDNVEETICRPRHDSVH